MAQNRIPRIIIGRLPLYLRALTRLEKDGFQYASSRELGKLLDISAAQIRKDLSHFGELGKRGKGYEIEFLIKKLNENPFEVPTFRFFTFLFPEK